MADVTRRSILKVIAAGVATMATPKIVTPELIDDLVDVIKGSPGKVEVYFRVERAGAPGVLIRAGNGLTTGPGEELERDIEAVLGPDRLDVAPSAERFRLKESGRRQGRWRERREARR